MIDSRATLAQDICGGHAGLPCARLRNPSYFGKKLHDPNAKLSPTLVKALKAELEQTDPLPTRKADDNAASLQDPMQASWKLPVAERVSTFDSAGSESIIAACRRSAKMHPFNALTSSSSAPSLGHEDGTEMVAFAGTRSMSFQAGRARTVGAFGKGGTGGNLTKGSMTYINPFKDQLWEDVIHKRTATDFHDLVDILRHAMSKERRQDLRTFRQPYNKHRHTMETGATEDQNRRRVLRTLKKFPLCNVYDLARCEPDEWTNISRELGGVSHGAAIRCALEYVQNSMSPVDRAAFWTAVGPRQRLGDQGRIVSFAGDQPYD